MADNAEVLDAAARGLYDAQYTYAEAPHHAPWSELDELARGHYLRLANGALCAVLVAAPGTTVHTREAIALTARDVLDVRAAYDDAERFTVEGSYGAWEARMIDLANRLALAIEAA